MKIPEPFIRIVYRMIGLRDGVIVIQKKQGNVVGVEINGRALSEAEYLPASLLHPPPPVVPRGTNPTR